MAVRIIVDEWNLERDSGAEEVYSSDVHELHSVRERIRQRLVSNFGGTLVLRMSTKIFERFSDMEGQPGLEVQRVSPHSVLRERLGGYPPPPWLTQDLAGRLGLFANGLPDPDPLDDSVARIISQLAPELLQADDLDSLVLALAQQPAAFTALLDVPEVSNWLGARLGDLGLAEGAGELLSRFGQGLREGYRELACAVLRERLDHFIVQHDLRPDFALPARVCSPTLARHFGPLPIDQKDAAPYPEYMREIMALAERQTLGREEEVESLADLVLQDWSKFLEQLHTSFEKNPRITSIPLIEALNKLESESARELAKHMCEYLDNARCETLPADASVRDVLRWSQRYFRYAIGAFDRGDEPDEEVSASFAHWVTTEHNRIIQSEYDWRVVASTVDQELAAGRVVILCVVDALGAIHNDLIELELGGKLGREVMSPIKPLFAPLPTITEVGKIAVLTGRDAQIQTSDYERAIRDRYSKHLSTPGSLQFVKNWKDFRQPLNTETRLLVYLENRIDDDLHQCTDFQHHRNRVQTVAKQMVQQISDWLLDVRRLGQDATILITADHGATKLSRQEPAIANTTPIERRILLTERKPVSYPDGFHFEQTKHNGGGYLIPWARVAFGSTETMLHGGLTPEEVLIPLIHISRGGKRAAHALRLRPKEEHCHPVTDGWHVTLCIENTVDITFLNLRIRAGSPFSGESQIIERIGPYEERNEIIFRITSEIEQAGRTTVPFELRYQQASNTPFERLELLLDLDLGSHLIQRDQAARDFDDAFD